MLGLKAVTIGNANKAQREAKADFEMGFPGVYIVTPQLFTREDVSLWTGDMLIVDEIHLLGRPGSKGQKKLSAYSSYAMEKPIDRKSTRLNSSHVAISYAVFRLK